MMRMKNPLQLLRHLTNESQYQLAIDWLAFLIQNEGKAKHTTALVVQAPKGAGKTTFFQYFAEMVAYRGQHIQYKELSHYWTSFDGLSCLVIDGVPASALLGAGSIPTPYGDQGNPFDYLIRNLELRVNKKNEPSRTVTNKLNVIILVNDDELPPLPAFYTVIKSDQKFDDWKQLDDEDDFPLLFSEYLEAIEIKTEFPTIALPQPENM